MSSWLPKGVGAFFSLFLVMLAEDSMLHGKVLQIRSRVLDTDLVIVLGVGSYMCLYFIGRSGGILGTFSEPWMFVMVSVLFLCCLVTCGTMDVTLLHCRDSYGTTNIMPFDQKVKQCKSLVG